MKRPAFQITTSAMAVLLTCSVFSPATLAQAANRPTLNVGAEASDVVTLDPHRATTTPDKGPAAQMFNALVRFAPGSADPKDLQPDLAEKWDASPDKKTWTFYLRKGVQFHGGYGEMKAADVVYSYQRSADKSRSSFSNNFDIIEKVEARDDYTVRFILKYPDATFLGRVSNYHAGHVVSKEAAEKLGDKFGQSPIGTGPFAFGERVTQQYVRLVANDTYFRGAPKLAGIVYRMIPSDSARELAFTSNEVDVMAGKREQRWVDNATKRGIKVDVFEPAEFRTIHINRTIKPLDNLKVRQAVAAAINVDEILKYVGKNVGDKGCSVIPNGYLGGDCSTGTYTYDVAAAKKLLAEAGFPGGITLKSIVSNVTAQQPIMQIIQAQLAKAGIKLDMEVVDHATYQAKSRQDQSALVFYGAARFPNADVWLSEFYDSASAIGEPKAMSNFSHCSVADAAIRAARIESEPQKQLALWKKAQQQIHADVCAVPLFGLKQVWVHSDRVNFGYTLKGSLNLQPPITELTTVTAGK
ncbi:ABC transporter substrate-binding protein [Simplicispira suum]|uniref:Polyamine ABC transporter substrate-binding protein n=1 Tax=Simplicispira suum TaxID=2109915 RepID=A0A2S0N2K4_9BURK|nr:ABC transporter substrate-binding protein [Simplicispira suum]AVO42365.1 polyamine ABC transporter substrate-binding protein [Simplicispira suum]